MNELEHRVPPRTIMEVFHQLPEGTRAELIQATLHMSSAPTSNHQRVIPVLSVALTQLVEKHTLGELFFAPYDIYLDEEANVVQHDIAFIPTHKLNAIHPSGFHRVPDFIIEVLSQGNGNQDSITKKAIYEQAGVRKYLTVNPDSKIVNGYSLGKNGFEEIESTSAKIQSAMLGHTFEC